MNTCEGVLEVLILKKLAGMNSPDNQGPENVVLQSLAWKGQNISQP